MLHGHHTPSKAKRQLHVSRHVEALESRSLLSAGTLDSGFGSGGLATLNSPSRYAAVKQLANGQILVAGTLAKVDDGGGDLSIWRLNANGTLDTSFGVSGTASVSFNINEYAKGMAIQSDGKIVVVGDAGVIPRICSWLGSPPMGYSTPHSAPLAKWMSESEPTPMPRMVSFRIRSVTSWLARMLPRVRDFNRHAPPLSDSRARVHWIRPTEPAA